MRIIVAGDYAPCGRIDELVKQRDYCFLAEIRQILSDTDFSIVNLESPVSDVSSKPINKLGPHLQCHEYGIEALKWAGFDGVTLANNHIYDYGDVGVKKTIDTCISNNLDYVGGGLSYDDASRILYKEINNETLAIINCCEHEFSLASLNKGGANPLNPVRLYYDILATKKKADYTIVIIHGGHEHFQLPSLRMVDLYHYCIDLGADAVINHHQHCFSGYEFYNEKPIFYGLGNFCFDGEGIKHDSLWNFGYMVKLEFRNGHTTSSIIPYSQCEDASPTIKLITDDSIHKKVKELNSIIKDPVLLKKHIDEYYARSIHDLRVVLSPINNRYLRAAQYRHLFPVVLSNKFLLRLEDFFMCESHRDKMEYFFNNRFIK